jgi:hypothetical protein
VKRGEILDEAKRLVTEVREKEHGNPHVVYADVARMWAALLRTEIDAGDVYQMLILMKICRDSTNHDNWVDIAGYAALAGEYYREPISD